MGDGLGHFQEGERRSEESMSGYGNSTTKRLKEELRDKNGRPGGGGQTRGALNAWPGSEALLYVGEVAQACRHFQSRLCH